MGTKLEYEVIELAKVKAVMKVVFYVNTVAATKIITIQVNKDNAL